MNILVADDDPVSRRVLAATLAHLGHTARLAEDGERAWAAFLEEPAEVVITDWMMPGLDGPELIQRIRAAKGERYTYVLLLTALRGREEYLHGMEAGADDFVTKPIDSRELHARLRVAERVLGLTRTVQRLEGLLPICAYCKKIREEGDRWAEVEDYVTRHSQAQFSHGFCPECYDRHLRPQLEQVEAAARQRGPAPAP